MCFVYPCCGCSLWMRSMLLAPRQILYSPGCGRSLFECGRGVVGPRDESVDAALGSGSLELTLLWHCRKADQVSSPLHLFFCLLLPLLTLQLLDLGLVMFDPDTV